MKRIIAVSLLPLSIYASTISFDEALKETLNNNNELKAKSMSIETAKENLKQAKSYDWGKLVFKMDESYTKGISLLGGSTDEDYGTKYRANYQVPIFTGFKLKYAKEMARLQVKAYNFKYKRDKNSLAIEVLKAYNGAVAAKAFIKALETAKKTTESFVEMTQNLNSQGMVVKSDLLSAQSRNIDVNAKIIEADSKYKLALAYLRFLTGDNKITDVEDFRVIISPEKNLAILKKEALKNRNDLKWMKSNLVTMQKNIKMAESNEYPTLGLQAEYGYTRDIVHKKISRNRYKFAGIELAYNVFDGFLQQTIREKAKIQAKKTQYYYTYMKDGIKVDVEQKYLDFQAKTAIIKEKIKNKDLAEQILSQYTDMYKNGLINISILLLKETDAEKARAELIKAKYDQSISAANLQLAVGNLSMIDILK